MQLSGKLPDKGPKPLKRRWKQIDYSQLNYTIMKTKVYKIKKERAITIAMNHNCVSREIAERYTDSELKEILKQLSLKSDF